MASSYTSSILFESLIPSNLKDSVSDDDKLSSLLRLSNLTTSSLNNFSRRYLPDQNVSSFLNGPGKNIQQSDQTQTFENNFDQTNLDNLPVID